MSIKVNNPARWVSDLFPDKMTPEQIANCKNIWWRVALTHIPPRDPEFEYLKEWGAGNIEPALYHEPLKLSAETKGGGQHVGFFFPERHITTQEEYVFVPMLKSHPQIVNAKLTIIDIVTKSALIIGNFLKYDVRIVKREEGDFSGKVAGMGLAVKTHEASLP